MKELLKRFLFPLGLIVSTGLALFLCFDFYKSLPNVLPIDDCYIILAYARNVLRYGDLFSYNHGLITTGITSPLYCLCIAAGKAITGDWLASVSLVGVIFFVASLTMGSLYAFKISERGQAGKTAAILFILFWGCWGYIGYFTFCGMEPIMHVAISFALLIAFESRRYLVTGLLLGASAMVRPESVFLALVLGFDPAARFAAALFRKDRAALSRPVKDGLLLIAGFLLTYGPWMAWCLSITGSVFPATVSVKTHVQEWKAILHYISSLVFMYDPDVFDVRFSARACGPSYWVSLRESFPVALLALAAVPYLIKTPRRLLPLLYPILHIALTCTKSTTSGENMRYMVLDYSFFMLYFAVAAAKAIMTPIPTDSMRAFASRTLIKSSGCIFAFLLTLMILEDYQRNERHFAFGARYFDRLDYSIGKWLADNTPPQAKVALNQAGGIKFFSDRETIDLVGLTDHTLFPYIKGPLNPAQALVDRDVDYIASFGEDWLAGWGLDMRNTALFTRIPLQCRGLYKVNKPALRSFVNTKFPRESTTSKGERE